MPSLTDATKKPSNIGELIPPATPTAQNIPPIIPREQPGLSPSSLGPAPSLWTTGYDSVRQWARPGTSQGRFPALPTKSNPQLNAAARSVATQVVASTPSSSGSGTPVSISLTAPAEIVVAGSPANATGTFALSWATQPAGYEFQVPNGTVGFDGSFSEGGQSLSSISITGGTPSSSPEWAFYAAACITANFSSNPSGWTALFGNSSNTALFWKALSGLTPLSVSQPITGAGSQAGVLCYFTGTGPTIRQQATAADTGVGAITANFSSNTTAGSFVLAVYFCTAPSPTQPPVNASFVDTQNLTQTFIGGASGLPTVGVGFAALTQVMLLNTCGAAAESVTITYPPTNGGQLVIYEIAGLTGLSAVPRFMPEAPTDFSKGINTLPPVNGGTGANLSRTGGTSKVVMQQGLGSVFTVRQLAAADLSDGTIGTGNVVKASTPTITTPQFNGVFGTYNGINLVGNGVPAEYAQVNLTGQAAAIGATTLYTPTATGMYRISAYLKVTTVDATSSTLGAVTITYTDGTDSVAQSLVMQMADQAGNTTTTNTANTTAAKLIGETRVWALTGVPIQYAVAYASNVAGTMKYEVHLKVEAL